MTITLERWRQSSAFLPSAGLLLVSAFMVVFTEHFLSLDNLLNIALQSSINGIIAAGMTAAILTGGIDLSVGAVVALSGTLCAGLMVQFGLPIAPAVALGLASGALFGAFNGVCVAWLRMPPIIVTLATMGIARGLALLYTQGYPIDGLPEAFAWLGSGVFAGLKLPVWIMLGCYALASRYVRTQRGADGWNEAASSAASAAAIAGGSSGANSVPVTPSVISSRCPPTLLAATSLPCAIASSGLSGVTRSVSRIALRG